jgi:DNA-binding MarR family transcriptional regulator
MNLSEFHRSVIPEHSLSLGQYIGLRFVAAKEPVRISVLARSFRIARPTATAFVDGMERRGWVRRVRSEDDRRAVVLRLTPKAHRTLGRIDIEQARFFQGAFARLSPARQRQAVRALEALGRAFEAELALYGRRGTAGGP